MKNAIRIKFFSIAAAAGLLAGCASQPPASAEFSGFLGSYSDMQQVSGKGTGLGTMYRYTSPKFTPANYNAIMFAPVQFYPAPEPTAQVSQETLNAILNYTTTTLRTQASKVVRVVDQPGYGVAKAQVAITGVSTAKQGLHAYQMIPIALVVTMAKRGVEGTPEDAKLVIEALATDSVTGEVLAKVVRTGTGSELAKALGDGQKEVTLDALKPVLDNWGKEMVVNLPQWIKAN